MEEAGVGRTAVKWTPNTGQPGWPVFVMVFPRSASRGPRLGRPPRVSDNRATDGAILVVEPEVGRQARLKLRNSFIIFDVDVFVFNAPPEPLHEDVVQRPPTTVPAHRDPRLLQAAGVLSRRELRPQVGVEALRPAPRQRLLQRLQTELPVQCVR